MSFTPRAMQLLNHGKLSSEGWKLESDIQAVLLVTNYLSISLLLPFNEVPNINISRVPSGCFKHRHDDTDGM